MEKHKKGKKGKKKKKSNQAENMATDQDMKKALQQIEKVLTGLKAMYEYLSKDIQEIKATQLTQNKRHEELAQVLEKFLQDPKFQATVDWSRNEKVHSLLLLSSFFFSIPLVSSRFFFIPIIQILLVFDFFQGL